MPVLVEIEFGVRKEVSANEEQTASEAAFAFVEPFVVHNFGNSGLPSFAVEAPLLEGQRLPPFRYSYFLRFVLVLLYFSLFSY